jgi:hypothetical protein
MNSTSSVSRLTLSFTLRYYLGSIAGSNDLTDYTGSAMNETDLMRRVVDRLELVAAGRSFDDILEDALDVLGVDSDGPIAGRANPSVMRPRHARPVALRSAAARGQLPRVARVGSTTVRHWRREVHSSHASQERRA